MTYLSVCSGIEAASVAWKPQGWQAVGFSEINPFACAVLAHRFPETVNFGDMTGFRTWDIAPFDVLVGGTPCQSFSVAGSRKGLADARGKLVYTFLEMVEHYRPKYIIWENVPGVLSDKTGVFSLFIRRVHDAGYLCDADILDAADFGVPQRRKRLFVVGISADYILGEYHETQENRRERACQRKAEAHSGRARGSSACMFGKRFNELVPITKTAQTVAARYGTGGCNTPVVLQQRPLTATNSNTVCGVRFITPVECERLQGFPDNWTRVPYRGKPEAACPKSLRYKAIGNSMAVPVMRWIGCCIDAIDREFR